MARSRGIVTLAAAAAGLALLTACSGSDSGNDSNDRKPPSKEQLLGKADLPAGANITYVELPKYIKQNITQLATAKTQPAACAGLVKALYEGQGAGTKGAVLSATLPNAGQIVEVLSQAKEDSTGALKKVVQKCGEVRSSAMGQHAVAKYKEFDTAGIKADKVYGLKVTSLTSADQTPTETVQITAIKNGADVTLNFLRDTGADPVKLTNKALSKLDS
ncbi:MAG: hypothetical protein ACRDQ5_06015 [Sciscionella sp.]